MKRVCFLMILCCALLMCGCTVRTGDDLYCLPKRSDESQGVQAAIDSVMTGLEYCAPLSGENQQAVQTADLNADGEPEYIVFAKGSGEHPLRILILQKNDGKYIHTQTIDAKGVAFDQVEYVQMTSSGCTEIAVGCLFSDQLMRSLGVYSFAENEAKTLISVNYTKFTATDIDADNRTELFVLRPGQTETDCGIAELYGMEDGTLERSNEVSLSEPVGNLKRMIGGRLSDGKSAIFVASAVGDTALITDVFAVKDGFLTNVSLSNASGTSVKTLRNYYVYAEDIDEDGVMELPSLIRTIPLDGEKLSERHEMICWYAMDSTGTQAEKLYTYHNFVEGWYLALEQDWTDRLSVSSQTDGYDFYILEEDGTQNRILSIQSFTGQNREQQASEDGWFSLYKTDSTVYAASLGEASEQYAITKETLMKNFRMIRNDGRTGEQ